MITVSPGKSEKKIKELATSGGSSSCEDRRPVLCSVRGNRWKGSTEQGEEGQEREAVSYHPCGTESQLRNSKHRCGVIQSRFSLSANLQLSIGSFFSCLIVSTGLDPTFNIF